MKRTIRLRGINGQAKGRVWEAAEMLRIGRLDPLEVVLDDSSVSRYHAEVRATDRGWRVRDLGSTNGTRLNGVKLGNGQWPLRARDLLQFGEVAVVVDLLEEEAPPVTISSRDIPSLVEQTSAIDDLRVEGTTKSSWDEAVEGLIFDNTNQPRAGDQLRALLRASHHLVHMEKEEDLLQSILEDAVSVLDAQRGAIVLGEGPDNQLKLRALVTGRNEPRAALTGRGEVGGRFHFSQSLANRCLGRGESILCQKVEEDDELSMARSISEGSMASVLCVLLRTPRKRLGVLHLDRSPWQNPFTMEELRLADGLAAQVSAGIECALLLKKQRDLFLDTITILAQAVELRDEYTGGHTLRVSTYALRLAEELGMEHDAIELIRLGTPLHDIGKIGITDEILRKPDKLTPAEFEVMKQHTVMGARIVETVPDLRPVLPIVRSHHERWDGKGYPDGLGGESIAATARVVAVCDAFDAMTSDRPYRKGMPPDVAFQIVEREAGKQFDPTCAAAFLRIRERILREMQAAQSTVQTGSRRTRSLNALVSVPSL